jgi:hypothetical protein
MTLGHDPFEWADRNRFIQISAPAGHLTWGAADPSADGGQGVGGVGDLVPPLHLTPSDRGYVASGVRENGAGGLALDHGAVILGVGDGYVIGFLRHVSSRIVPVSLSG